MRTIQARKASVTNTPRRYQRLLTIPADDTVSALAEQSPIWVQHTLDLLDATGMRSGELLGTKVTYKAQGKTKTTHRRGLTLGDVLYDDGTVRDTVVIVGKGDKQREIPLNKRAKRAISALSTMFGSSEHDHLLVPVKPQTFSRHVREAKKRAGINIKFTPHSLRHRACTKLVKAKLYKHAQLLAGHSDPKVTIGTYTHVDMVELAEAVETHLA